MTYKTFQKYSSTYTCHCCARLTRAVGDEINSVSKGTGLCADCWELAGLENANFDGCINTDQEKQLVRNSFKYVLDKSGKNVASYFPELAKAVGWV